MGPRGLSRFRRERNVTRGEVRNHHLDVNGTDEDIAEFRGGLYRPLGGDQGRTHVTPISQRLRQYEECGDPRDPVVVGLGLGDHIAQQGYRPSQVALNHVCGRQPPPALARSETVTDGVGDLAPFLRRRPQRDVVTGDQRGLGLLAENLGQPPLVPQRPGQADRLGEIPRSQFGVVDGGAGSRQ